MANKIKTRKMPEDEYEEMCYKIFTEVAPTSFNGRAGTTVFMVDGDFQPTQNMAEVRFIMTDSPYDVHLFIVDNAGEAILIKKGD